MRDTINSNIILVTGGAGFIGSNFILFLLENDPGVRIINLDKLTYAGSLDNLNECIGNPRYEFIKGDICDSKLVKEIFESYKITGVVNFAAESHVDNSIERPDRFIKTNIEGTFVLLEAAKTYWMDEPNRYKKGFEDTRFLHISTDEVYGSLGKEGLFREDSPYAPNSPYSASKAASDFLVRSYHHTYGINTITSNCSNNFGPKQHDEKLIPTIIRKALADELIPIYGSGENIRDWLFVEDHCKALKLIYNNGRFGATYLIGGNNEQVNIDIATKICAILDNTHQKNEGSYKDQIAFVSDRPGHDYRYAIDSRKLQNELGWSTELDFDQALRRTIDWYIKKYQKV